MSLQKVLVGDKRNMPPDFHKVKLMIVAILIECDMNLFDDLLEAIIDKTIVEVNKDNDGKNSKEDWKAFVSKNPSLLKNMTFPYFEIMEPHLSSDAILTRVVTEKKDVMRRK
ncbi:hypothetical protein RJT34_13948 [Clitoria ternatea]|uniref:Calcineurin B-like protein n=1 Tax=Clitoria ternatea TaxID=43366 RepID=A0AAN9PM80_CLITE